MGDWIAFWDSAHSIYVNARHRDVHYLLIAEDMARYVPKGGVVLDYGCGDALHANIPAEIASRLYLCEAAPKLRATLAERFAGDAKIVVSAPEEIAALPNGTFDLIVMHSVAQYLTQEEFGKLLALFHRLLKPDGHLVLGDIIPPNISAATDARALLRLAAGNRFFFAALFGLVRTVLSNYWDLRSELGLTRYSKEDMLEKLTHAGFWGRIAHTNIGHNQARVTYVVRLA